ncbi:MAG: hypothetical protein H6605_00020 [Flavobacteriales bacterium]|nr:hypothetical protein [Flavobacteriales bacterium]
MKKFYLVCCGLLLNNSYNFGQAFDERHGLVNGSHDYEKSEMVSCTSISEDYDYVGVCSTTGTSPNEKMEAVFVLDDGTLYTSVFYHLSDYYDNYNFQPMKIVPLNSDDGYIIVGYVYDRNSSVLFHPFVMTTDEVLDPSSGIFKIFDIDGYFTDVDQLPNDDFLFCGSTNKDFSLTSSSMTGLIIKTNSSLALTYMRFVYGYNPSGSYQRFDIIQDALIIDDDTAIILGSVTEQCSTTYTKSRIVLAKLNLNTGAFVWQKCEYSGNYLASRMAINDDYIAIGMNAESGSTAGQLAFYDRGGNFVSGKTLKYSPVSNSSLKVNGSAATPSGNINTEYPFIQNLYFRTDDKLFVSGKFQRISYPGSPHVFDMPFSFVIVPSTGTISSTYLYQTDHYYGTVGLFANPTTSLCNGDIYSPIWPPSNTVPRVSGSNEFVTISHDMGKVGVASYYRFKQFAFTDNFTCGNLDIGSPNDNDLNMVSHSDVSNDNVIVCDEDDYDPFYDTQGYFDFDCGQ